MSSDIYPTIKKPRKPPMLYLQKLIEIPLIYLTESLGFLILEASYLGEPSKVPIKNFNVHMSNLVF